MNRFAQHSRFWESLASEHASVLASHGFETVKRRQALRYFTWQWDWRRLRRSEQFRFLVRHVSLSEILASVIEPSPLSRAAWRGCGWQLIDRYLYVVATRLLWHYAEHQGLPAALALGEPLLGSPFPVQLRRQLISQDLANGALEARTIVSAIGTTSPRHIVEVGAGYGRTAYILLLLFPETTYTIVDIEPARSIADWYWTALFPTRDIRFVAPERLDLITEPADLIVSISSLQEMLPEQIAAYLHWMDSLASGGTIYLKQWDHWRNPVDEVSVHFDDYPIPNRWEQILDAPAPVQASFRERAWRVPLDLDEA